MAESSQIVLWVLRAQVGDRDALDQLLRAVQMPIYRCVDGIVRDKHMAEDLLQDVLVTICRKLRTLRDPALFRPWCYRIATRAAFRRVKRRRREADMLAEQPPTDPALSPTAHDTASRREQLDQVILTLDHVPPASRAVLVLHYLESMPLKEVAAVLGLAVGTVKSRLSYGLSVMRRRLAENE